MLDKNKIILNAYHLKKCKLVIDVKCEVEDLLWDYADEQFSDFANHTLIPGAVYVIGREQLSRYRTQFRELAENGTIKIVFSNPAEGSSTIKNHCEYVYNVADLLLSKKMLLIGGAEMPPEWPCLAYESFLPKVRDWQENIDAMTRMDEIYQQTDKPYKFLFLNGRFRAHRKYLIERFAQTGLLDQSIWSNLDSQAGPGGSGPWFHDGQDLMSLPRPVKFLEPRYEIDRYVANMQNNFGNHFVKHELFTAFGQAEWGEIYLKPEMYIDTYFSLITETVFEYPYSFRTEKIWKAIAMGHPWIVAANAGYYRDIQNLGFKTFGHLIDERFDQVEPHWARASRIVDVVEDLCKQDLASFLKECYTVCKYNQELLIEKRPQVRQAFPLRFFKFLMQNNFQ
jgi:hypothetical protein